MWVGNPLFQGLGTWGCGEPLFLRFGKHVGIGNPWCHFWSTCGDHKSFSKVWNCVGVGHIWLQGLGTCGSYESLMLKFTMVWELETLDSKGLGHVGMPRLWGSQSDLFIPAVYWQSSTNTNMCSLCCVHFQSASSGSSVESACLCSIYRTGPWGSAIPLPANYKLWFLISTSHGFNYKGTD